MATQIQLRRDTAADWTSVNPTLASGEIGVETDTGQFKIGDGSTAWTSLGYASSGADHGGMPGLADDDHTQYALADGSRGNFEASGAAAAALSTHEAAADPHPAYLLESGLTKAAIDALNVDADTLDGTDSTGFATAAQGTLADSAVQPADDADTLGSGAATDGHVLTADGAGGAAWEAAAGGGGGITAVVEDTTPQLGGDLDGQSNTISDVVLTSISESVVTLANNTATPDLDLALGNHFVLDSPLQNITLSVSNVPASGVVGFTLLFTQSDPAVTVTEATGFDTELEAAAGDTVLYSGVTYDGGTTWHTGVLGQATNADTLDGEDSLYYRARANHTGSQTISTVTGLQDALDSKSDTTHEHADDAALVATQYGLSLSDEDTPIAAPGLVGGMHLPSAFTLDSVVVGLNTADSTGLTIDVHDDSDTTIFSTPITVDAAETTNLTAATPAVISTSEFSTGDYLTFYVDDEGAGEAAGLKIWLIGTLSGLEAVTSSDVDNIVQLTQSEYDALGTPDDRTLYVVVG